MFFWHCIPPPGDGTATQTLVPRTVTTLCEDVETHKLFNVQACPDPYLPVFLQPVFVFSPSVLQLSTTEVEVYVGNPCGGGLMLVATIPVQVSDCDCS